ncbi:S8 family serine peptidase [uncultured Draconibacterium sp.]|uniref:S8 family peptidase n=1 Tax=uncultured Draconibacterium sp. TaxID=1573823 RepID=UPI0025E4FE55|nr:S8 family serine peptidase [uncultured Draconibacterium sp.]
MKKMLWKIVPLFLMLAVIQSCNEALVETESPDEMGMELKSASSEKQSYIVVLNDAELSSELSKLKGYEKKQEKVKATTAKILKRAGITDGEIGYAYTSALQGFSVKLPPGQLKKLEADPSVKYVEEDQVVILKQPTNILKRPTPTPSESTPYGVPRVGGGATYSGSNVAWVLDTGIDLDHPDLNVDAGRSVAFGQTTPDDGHGHGTHCAGTIAAIDNEIGVIGVAAGATVIAVRILDYRGYGLSSDCIAGVDHVAANGTPGDVANMSVGYPNESALDQAVVNAASQGIFFAVAAGNDGMSIYDAIQVSPGRANGTNLWTVSAMDINDDFAYFSNYGYPTVDICGPGVDVYSCYLNGGYTTMSGTSMATPHVAGVLLVTGGNPGTDGYVDGDPDGNADPIAYIGEVAPPVNQAPNANFSYSVSDLTVSFADASTDDNGITSWSWDFNGEGSSTAQNPSFTFGGYGSKTVSLTVSDGEYTDTYTEVITLTEEPVGGDITLTAVMRKVRGIRYVDLTWSGANGSQIDVKINGVTTTTINNDGSETLDMGRSSGTFVFTVCETDGSSCSNDVSLLL